MAVGPNLSIMNQTQLAEVTGVTRATVKKRVAAVTYGAMLGATTDSVLALPSQTRWPLILPRLLRC